MQWNKLAESAIMFNDRANELAQMYSVVMAVITAYEGSRNAQANHAAHSQQNGDLQGVGTQPAQDRPASTPGRLSAPEHTRGNRAGKRHRYPHSYDAEQLRPYVQVTDDPPDHLRFLKKFRFMHRFYTSKETTQRVVREAITDAALDNIRYLELRFNPYALSNFYNFPMSDVVEWVLEATEQAQAETGTRTCLILTIPREKSLKMASEMVDLGISLLRTIAPWHRPGR